MQLRLRPFSSLPGNGGIGGISGEGGLVKGRGAGAGADAGAGIALALSTLNLATHSSRANDGPC